MAHGYQKYTLSLNMIQPKSPCLSTHVHSDKRFIRYFQKGFSITIPIQAHQEDNTFNVITQETSCLVSVNLDSRGQKEGGEEPLNL